MSSPVTEEFLIDSIDYIDKFLKKTPRDEILVRLGKLEQQLESNFNAKIYLFILRIKDYLDAPNDSYTNGCYPQNQESNK